MTNIPFIYNFKEGRNVMLKDLKLKEITLQAQLRNIIKNYEQINILIKNTQHTTILHWFMRTQMYICPKYATPSVLLK